MSYSISTNAFHLLSVSPSFCCFPNAAQLTEREAMQLRDYYLISSPHFEPIFLSCDSGYPIPRQLYCIVWKFPRLVLINYMKNYCTIWFFVMLKRSHQLTKFRKKKQYWTNCWELFHKHISGVVYSIDQFSRQLPSSCLEKLADVFQFDCNK